MTDLVQSDATPGVYDTMESSAPQIMVLQADGVSYNRYYLISDGDDGTERFDLTGWVDSYGVIADADEVACGTAYWFLNVGADTTLTMPGQVLTDASVTKELTADQYGLIGNPYPVALKLTSVTATFQPGMYDTMESEAPQFMVLQSDGVSYDRYYFISDGDDGTERFDLTGWVDSYGVIVTEPIAEVSQGFWVRLYSGNGGKVTFKM